MAGLNRRTEILNATIAAAKISSRFNPGNRSSFDVIGATSELGIPCVFRPLKDLWGAAVTINDTTGIIVTSVLDLAVQRFTLAHELGHVLLGHKMSFDKTIGFTGRFGPDSIPAQEIAADTFASELLAPKALMVATAKRHQWTKAEMQKPENIYQMALRLGISYQAQCWALADKGVITQATAKKMAEQTVKKLKVAMVGESLLSNSRANVWSLTAGDSGTEIEGGPDDIFALHLNEKSSAGYLWEILDKGSAEVVDEKTAVSDLMGGGASRILYLKFPTPGIHRLTFEHRRPWNKESIEHIDIGINSYGKELGGFARRFRLKALGMGAA